MLEDYIINEQIRYENHYLKVAQTEIEIGGVAGAAHIRVTSLKTGFWGAYEDSDRDVAITRRSMVTSSGIERGKSEINPLNGQINGTW